MTRFFINKSAGSLAFGLYPIAGWALDWRDAEDGRTFIRPRIYRIRYHRTKR